MEQQYTKIILKSGKEQSLLRFHPWVFSGAVKRAEGPLAEGDVVEVISHRGDFLALGHYQVGSIMVRLFSFRPVVPDFVFWKEQLQKAWNLRHSLGLANNPETNVFRLVNGEGDGFPGLIIDFYNGVAVMQMHSLGMYRIRQELAAALKEILGDRLLAVYDKSEKTLPFKAGISPCDGYLLGEAQQTVVSEYGLRFQVDWEAGQKTGFFIDQRENRRLVQQYAAGRDVLNMFCYTGGFSFFALRGGARLVHSVDASARAIALTNENVTLNFADEARHQAFVADAADFLKNIKDQYDLIILDPPAFSKHRDTLGQALQAYKRLNARAFEQIRPGGLLFTFSCSQVVSKEKFREAVFSGAAIAGRSVRILHQLTQPADHPVNIYHPEGEYLKGLVLWVE
ncbi:MAG TPA: class I SAM-dependent rRNA methyltransferase [Prolixibacteraceae bacterium]|nr:class I SAM-dependent rRNA methyltransferase [Prolixibacteraceae bacterium]